MSDRAHRAPRARIAITGFGSVNALGVGVEELAQGLRAGRCAIGQLTLFPADGYRSACAAQVGPREREGLMRSAHSAKSRDLR